MYEARLFTNETFKADGAIVEMSTTPYHQEFSYYDRLAEKSGSTSTWKSAFDELLKALNSPGAKVKRQDAWTGNNDPTFMNVRLEDNAVEVRLKRHYGFYGVEVGYSKDYDRHVKFLSYLFGDQSPNKTFFLLITGRGDGCEDGAKKLCIIPHQTIDELQSAFLDRLPKNVKVAFAEHIMTPHGSKSKYRYGGDEHILEMKENGISLFELNGIEDKFVADLFKK